MQPTTIDDVIAELDNVINWCRQNQSRIGYFACLYRKMTLSVKQGIAQGKFQDGKRMELLDVIFANRYLQAWKAYISKEKCSNAWCAAFDVSSRSDLIVLQHLLLGINTHINLDLAIAAVESCPGEKIYGLENDFNHINDVIAGLMDEVQADLASIWAPLKRMASLAGKTPEQLMNFNIAIARKTSWANAIALSVASGKAKEEFINLMDNNVVKLANGISSPGSAAKLLLRFVLLSETKSVNDIISKLYD